MNDLKAVSIAESLFAYSQWAHSKIFQLCQSLTPGQWDEPRDMGFGSLRNTLFHNLAAEEVWYERWTAAPWRPFPISAEGMEPATMLARLATVHEQRQNLIDRDRSTDWSSSVTYHDAKGNAYTQRLKDLLLHVANHSVHHRAQALNFMKPYGLTMAGGIDYLFFRLAHPSHPQSEAAAESLRNHGLEVNGSPSPPVVWDGSLVLDYFQYGDWAIDKLFPLMHLLEPPQLEHDFQMGMGSIRKTWFHLFDAEQWWWRNWSQGPSQYEKTVESTTLHELKTQWESLRRERNAWIQKCDGELAQRIVIGRMGNADLAFPMVETMLQLCVHGTHHRAQVVNMLRRSELKPPAIDYVVKLREDESSRLKNSSL